jgi:hypothetical protein
MLVWFTMGTENDPRKRLRADWADSLSEHMEARQVTRKGLRLALAGYGVQVTEQAIGCWLRAETSPRPEHQAAIAAVMQVPVRRLFPIEPAAPETVAS